MRHALASIAVVCALAIVPAVGSAQTTGQAKPAAKSASKTASHATTGVVKSISDTSLVISKPGKTGSDMTFDVNSSTHKDGTIEVGVPVSVRYTEQGTMKVATAITAQHTKQQASSKSTKAHQ
jgi:hypothetical protein